MCKVLVRSICFLVNQPAWVRTRAYFFFVIMTRTMCRLWSSVECTCTCIFCEYGCAAIMWLFVWPTLNRIVPLLGSISGWLIVRISDNSKRVEWLLVQTYQSSYKIISHEYVPFKKLYRGGMAERSSASDLGSDGRVVRMWVQIPTATMVLMSLSKTQKHCNCFSSPRSINGYCNLPFLFAKNIDVY